MEAYFADLQKMYFSNGLKKLEHRWVKLSTYRSTLVRSTPIQPLLVLPGGLGYLVNMIGTGLFVDTRPDGRYACSFFRYSFRNTEEDFSRRRVFSLTPEISLRPSKLFLRLRDEDFDYTNNGIFERNVALPNDKRLEKKLPNKIWLKCIDYQSLQKIFIVIDAIFGTSFLYLRFTVIGQPFTISTHEYIPY
ncbi:uncharacterized protein LOC143145453 [Ptiloglossa arizonensis]|uniref:uncharacterized protein LOC143145453 n=1 Tax=Ptiloglossa arizonensis TaxID=3350558 RepID=UPI003F9FF147